MTNKILSLFFILLVLSITFSIYSYATDDILMDLNQDTVSTDNPVVDNTTYTNTGEENIGNEGNVVNSESGFDYATPTVNTNYEDSSEGLSITNMINIVFIVVGIVLILLGIAIIIKLK